MKQRWNQLSKQTAALLLAFLVGAQTFCVTAFARSEYIADDNFRSRIVDVTIASVSEDAYKAEGEVNVEGADKVVFYVWETSNLTPLKEKYEYYITLVKGGIQP